MKKRYKFLFALVATFVLLGVVYAKNRVINEYAKLSVNQTFQGEGELGVDFKTGMENIVIQGNTPCTVETTLKKKVLLAWVTSGSTNTALNKNSTTSAVTYWGNSSLVLTRVIWKNKTSGSTVAANFFAENN